MHISILLSIIVIQISCSTHKFLRHKNGLRSEYRTSYYDNTLSQPTCAENEEFSICGNEYGGHCRDILRPSGSNGSAHDMDCSDGCFCSDGFYRNDVNGLCVTKKDCYADKYNRRSALQSYDGKQRFRSNFSNKNNHYLGDYRQPENKQFRYSVYYDRKQQLKYQIYMMDEQRRHYILSQVRDYYTSGKKRHTIHSNSARIQGNKKLYDQKYVSNYQSTRRCGRPNEIYQRCGTDCGKTCNKIREDVYCDPNVVCRSGCFCVNGYVRDDFGHCITRYRCTIVYSKCGKHKKYQKCGNYCNMLCVDYLMPGQRKCDNKKCFEGCFCINAMFMNSKNHCVPPKLCAK